ncbi:MAG: lactate dehydrogenase [Clostridiales bacterium]|nr:lactate dehydrogenase [Clostridiales bacterium]
MRRLSELRGERREESAFFVGSREQMAWWNKSKKRVHLFALGDVGGMLLTGLRLLGRDVISEIGIYDIREGVPERWEFEMNQMVPPERDQMGPKVTVLKESELFSCDVFLFCASLRVPPLEEKTGDVRMAQFQANSGLVRKIAEKAVQQAYQGLFAVVSDPVDPLCFVAADAGLEPERVKGFGLGVMNARAVYYARREAKFSSYLTEGRVYGPHGEDLVAANSLNHYDDKLSVELTDLTAHANLVMREMGFKPYMAPAISSGAYSILAMLRGDWNYSSVWMKEVFFGCRNRTTEQGFEVENPEMPDELFQRCNHAYQNLKVIH